MERRRSKAKRKWVNVRKRPDRLCRVRVLPYRGVVQAFEGPWTTCVTWDNGILEVAALVASADRAWVVRMVSAR